MKIAIVWDWHITPAEFLDDKQEKLQAWRLLAQKHQVHFHAMGEFYTLEYRGDYRLFIHSSYRTLHDTLCGAGYDVILSWGSIDRPIHNLLKNKKPCPVAYQFAGGVHNGDELELFDLVFTQNLCDKIEFEKLDKRTVQLFGVDKSFWTPDLLQEVRFHAIYPASFCSHKRNEVVAEKYGRDACLPGKWIIPGIVDCCKSFGSLVLPNTSHKVLRQLYRASERCVIPAIAGSQRTIAEALSCGLKVDLLYADNVKCREILENKITLLDTPEMSEIYERELLRLVNER